MTERVRSRVQLPLNRIKESARQRVLDAAAVLQVRRSQIAAQLATGESPEAEIVAVGPAINDWLYEKGHEWDELLSVRSSATAAQLRVSVPSNRYFLARGVKMVSLFNYEGLELGARIMLANEPTGNYLFGVGPVQMKIIERRFVLLQGPEIDGAASVMSVTAPTCMEAAWRYWEAAVASAIPLETTGDLSTLTPRQRQIAGLLASDFGDDAVAAAVGVSVRTVRSDIALMMETLGVKSRFAAGIRLHLWSEGERVEHDREMPWTRPL
jgi:DNA-binding CsgD family transcriptional regulator